MKKQTIKILTAILATVVTVIVGCGKKDVMVVKALATDSQISANLETEEETQQIEETSQIEETEQIEETTEIEESEEEIKEPSKIIFVGDSRTVGMYCYTYNNWKDGNTVIKYDLNGDFWSSKVSMGYKWMVNTGIPAIEDKITDNTAVVILMGVNDITEANIMGNYAAYINNKAAEWKAKGADTYFVSINPVRKPNYGVTNELISQWNNIISSTLSEDVEYIDTFSTLLNSAVYADDVHYKADTYTYIYNTIRNVVNGE